MSQRHKREHFWDPPRAVPTTRDSADERPEQFGEVAANPTAPPGGIVGVPPLYGAPVDNYSTNFIRAYWNPAAHAGDLFDGQYHQMKFSLKGNPPNPGGALFADTDAIRANGGVAWFDNNGTLGKIILRRNNQPPEREMTADEMADAIDAGAGLVVKPEGVNLVIVGIIP